MTYRQSEILDSWLISVIEKLDRQPAGMRFGVIQSAYSITCRAQESISSGLEGEESFFHKYKGALKDKPFFDWFLVEGLIVDSSVDRGMYTLKPDYIAESNVGLVERAKVREREINGIA